MPASEERIYIFIAADDFELARQTGSYRAASLAVEGFIHASPWNQLVRVADKYYSAASDLRLMHIDPALVAAEIRWEPAARSLYPHIYGPLNMDAVVRTTAVSRAENGEWLLENGLDSNSPSQQIEFNSANHSRSNLRNSPSLGSLRSLP